ncbi:hypothetical protein GMDG_07630 [Pseudogymnoascus destructans 20631-21]|uniref:Autophagy protein 5 n=1 Tax=Pseudogymnoascus destructans (strain ATCC MYA-4855 / 20631-21) TaxID=658429 RepID=L8FYA9_PSED2|nr:hypothetical protein GMDG_07630 [Pseudogymnoascus destructans 20631-21]
MASPLTTQIWSSTVPLHITLAPSLHPSSGAPPPYLLNIPRLSYLPLLLPRLSVFFHVPLSSFTYEGIELRLLPAGLLADLYAPQLPWRIVVGDGWGVGERGVADGFMNSVKEADFLRYGSAKGIMSMSAENSTALWDAVKDNNCPVFAALTRPLLNPASPLRHIPLRIYIPHPDIDANNTGSFRVIQGLVTPRLPNNDYQTLGHALHTLIPSLFPSRRDPILAAAILHGARVPLHATLDDLMRECAYADGWVAVVGVML